MSDTGCHLANLNCQQFQKENWNIKTPAIEAEKKLYFRQPGVNMSVIM
jgi:hypothetical protein